jgi:hypothetical protein
MLVVAVNQVVCIPRVRKLGTDTDSSVTASAKPKVVVAPVEDTTIDNVAGDPVPLSA